MSLLPVESEHTEKGQELRYICTHPSEHGTWETGLVDTEEPSGISLLKLNYEFTCCIISSLTPFVCLFVQCIVVEGVRDHSWELFLFFPPCGF